MTIKVTYNVTDVYVTQDVSPVYINVSYSTGSSGGAAVWGGITGTLSDQTDLQTALDGKFDDPTGDTTQYIAGDGSLVAFPITGQAGTLVREVRNVTGATLTKGTVVYINGASGNKPTVAKAIATSDATSAQTFGLIQADIPNNSNGYLVAFGDLDGLNTSAFAEGVQLYLSATTAGDYTSTKQYAPSHLVYIGVVTRQHVNQGRIEVRIQNGYEMDELHDVAAQTPSNNDGLFYNSTNSLWENKSIATALGYTPANSATTLTINGVTYDLSANRSWTVSGGISGSGASGQVAYWTGTSAQTGSNNLFWDATNSRLGIGTNAPTHTVDVVKNYNGANYIYITNTTSGTSSLAELVCQSSNGTSSFGKNSALKNAYKTLAANDTYFLNQVSGDISLHNDFTTGNIKLTAGGSSTAHMTLHNTGNLLLGSTTNSGERLQVTGTMKVTDDVTLTANVAATKGYTATNSNSGGTATFNINNNLSTNGFFRVYGSAFGSGTISELSDIVGFGSTKSIKIFVDASVSNGGTNSIQFMAGGYTNDQERARIGTYGMLIGTKTSTASSILTLASTTQGFLPPRMTTTQKNAISSPAAGLVVYDTTLAKLCVYTTAWETITSI